ncbi:MAG: M60 family metallopeptidase [Saprospiraceae bacterium]|nr:M60 family metallopeptidase [Saprospiraceae bacterium]
MKKISSILLVCSLIIISATQYSQAQCPIGYSQIIVNIIPDTYPNETSWDIKDTANTIIASGTTNNDTICYPTSNLLYFTIYDSYGDGICCGAFGDGSYNVYLDGNLVASGGQFTFSETTTFNYPPGVISAILINDFQQLMDHCNNTTLLSAAQINSLAANIHQYHLFIADDLPVITSAFALINCYEANTGPIFLNTATTGGFPNSPGALDGFEYDRVIFLIQQELFDVLYTKNKIAQYSTFLQGRKYLTSNYFPGTCPLPVDSSQVYNATVNASMPTDWGKPTAWSTTPARRPTGYYLSPGSIGKVTVPNVMVNAGYKILVGAHPLMNSTVHTTVQRFFGISNTYDITDSETLIANPFGGGIYIITPYPASAGLQQIELTNVVPAPFFSAKSFDLTTLGEWQNVQRLNPAPWADFESEKFMMQVPTSFIYNYNDPVTLMADWDARMDVVSNLLGYPLVRNNQVLYVMLDVQIKHGAYGIGNPQINNPYSPYDVQNGNSQHWFLKPGAANMWESEFHELGHAQAMVKFPGEEEAIVNLLSATIFNELYGIDIDSAFGWSFNNEYWRSRDQSAINWMVTHNFRIGNPMDISNTTLDEVRYQHRGYGKYVEIAALFGWEALENYYHQVNLDYINGVPPGSLGQIDDRILKLSKAAGVDLRPLIHFWGVHPQDSAALSLAINSNDLQPSPLICNRLVHYQSIIPMDSAQFSQQAQVYFNGSVPPGGNPDYENGWYNVWLPLYNNLHGDSAVVALQNIIDTYFPNGCTTVNVPIEINDENYVSVFPNPNTGQFTISLPDDNAEIIVADLLGRQILKTQATQKTTNLQLDNNGVYIIYVTTKRGTATRKVIVNR